MPKIPPVERFRITCFVAKELLGETMAALTRLGLTDVHFDLVTDVPQFAQRSNHVIKSEPFLTEWLKNHPTFRALEVVQAFRADGRTPGAAYTALRNLAASGALNKLGDGMYSRSDVRALTPPKKKKKTVSNIKKYDVPNGEFIVRYARRNHGRFNIPKLKQLFEADRRNVGSVWPTVSDLVEQKRVKRVGDGQYVLASAKPKQPKAAKPKKTKALRSVNNIIPSVEDITSSHQKETSNG